MRGPVIGTELLETWIRKEDALAVAASDRLAKKCNWRMHADGKYLQLSGLDQNANGGTWN